RILVYSTRSGAPRELPSFPTRRSSDLFAKGDLLARRGEPKLGISIMQNAMAELERTGAKLQCTMRLGCLAAAHMSLGQFEVASGDRKSTRLNSSHLGISYAVFCLKKKI